MCFAWYNGWEFNSTSKCLGLWGTGNSMNWGCVLKTGEETEIHPFCGSRMVLTEEWSPGTGELLKALEHRNLRTV